MTYPLITLRSAAEDIAEAYNYYDPGSEKVKKSKICLKENLMPKKLNIKYFFRVSKSLTRNILN